MRQLLVMRHAKSDWEADYAADHDRPLNERGVRSARLMGRFLTARGLVPDLIITSTALRARSTAELAASAGAWDADIYLESGFYEEGPDGVIGLAGRAPDVARRLMMVGHQPTWSGLVAAITGKLVEMKTASVAVIDVEIDTWSALGSVGGTLEALHHPRSFFGSEWDRP